MPAKLERCVEEVMKSQGIPKERAYAICTTSLKSAEDKMLIDRAFSFKGVVDELSGFLTAPVTLARTGVQYYYGFELGLHDRALDMIGVYRPASEVFHPDSIASFVNAVATDDHPIDVVTIDNVKQLQVGSVSEVKQQGEHLVGILTITDKEVIEKIRGGKKEVSVGYGRDLVPSIGEVNGEKYEFEMRAIRANHLAIVDAGRCGSACKINIDHKLKGDKQMIKVTIGNISFDVENPQLAQAIINQQKQFADEMTKAEEEKKKMEEEKDEEIEELKKKKEEAEAQKDVAMKSTLSSDAINKLVAERAQLLADAKVILGDKMLDCMDCPKEIKVAVVDSVFPDMELDGKSDEYINASYDMAVKQFMKAKGTVDALGNDFTKTKVKPSTREQARDNYMSTQLGLGEGGGE